MAKLLAVAAELARRGELPAEAFRFVRRILGMKAAELAEILNVTAQTISRRENGKQAIERHAAATGASTSPWTDSATRTT
jgi:DNA-binding transcriptional regulator YiaG